MNNAKTTTHSSIPAAYWQTAEGNQLGNTMHSNGWEAHDTLNDVADALTEALEAATDPVIKHELERALQKVQASLEALHTAHDILSDHIF